MDPLETLVIFFIFVEYVNTRLIISNERGHAFKVGPRDVAQERGELLYHVLLLCVFEMVYCLCLVVNCV